MTFIDKQADVVALVEDIAHANMRASELIEKYKWEYLDAQYWFRQSHVDHSRVFTRRLPINITLKMMQQKNDADFRSNHT